MRLGSDTSAGGAAHAGVDGPAGSVLLPALEIAHLGGQLARQGFQVVAATGGVALVRQRLHRPFRREALGIEALRFHRLERLRLGVLLPIGRANDRTPVPNAQLLSRYL